MRILIESPSCNALEGSNAAVGYGWVRAIARHHEVFLVTAERNYDRGHPEGAAPPIPNVHPIRIPSGRTARLGSLTDFVVTASRRRNAIIDEVRPDLVHSLEPAGWMGPRALATDRVPYVLGPLNGGSVMPPRGFAVAVLEALPVKPAKAMLRQGPKKLVVSLLNEFLFGPTPTARSLAHTAMRKADSIILGTGLGPGALPRRAEHRVRRLTTQGIDLAHFRPAERRPATGPLSVVYAGRVTPWKGLHLVVEAVARSDARLRVYGSAAGEDAWYEEHCRARADALGAAGRIEFRGPVPRAELAEAYASADVFCMLSLWEPYATTWIESFACGTPVIGLATGGMPEAIESGTGWMIEPTTPDGVVDDLAVLLEELARDRAAVHEAGVRAREIAEERYSWERLGERMDEIYAEVVSR